MMFSAVGVFILFYSIIILHTAVFLLFLIRSFFFNSEKNF